MTPRFVAEISSNHNGSLDRGLRLVDAAAECGCWAVKFQLFRIDDLFAPEILAASPEHQRRRRWELPPEHIPALANHAWDRGLEFGCTPFYLDAVEQLLPHVAFFKIASYELLWEPLLGACARSGKPVILSTGMATEEEIARAISTLHGAGCRDLALLHCVSGYPTPPAACNLAAIASLREAFGLEVGWSDHSKNPDVVARAVHRWGAPTVEFHLDLDGEGVEFRAGHCWLPEEAEAVIQNIKTGVTADGDGIKQPTDAERADRQWRADPSDGLRPLLHVRHAHGVDSP